MTSDHRDLRQGRHRGAAHVGAPLAAGPVVNGDPATSATWLQAALVDYLSLRRALGFALRRDEKLLVQFLAYLEETR